ncbi:unnamed protein product [Notodromas monacha]|uniref:Longin domain-containing protein n=1 Tax=Notodromas monacha TaxID=399045 RepID=A0A7R9GHL0_9CRUS|nr:unnamed protein product [Notodromas monacha]CAG0922928.1 unnamed protein product [Notodromas monacha]
MKLLARKLRQFDDRCLLQVGKHSVCSVTSLDVGYLALCEASYSDVLVFGFLEEMLKQFIKLYDVPVVDRATRPFAFIEFDKVIQSLRQKYNSKVGVVQRLNFGALSEELRLRPPSVIGKTDLEDLGVRHPVPDVTNGVGSAPHPVLTHSFREELVFAPLGCINLFWIFVTVILASINFYRGVISIHLANVFEIDGPTVSTGLSLVIESFLQISQAYFLASTNQSREFGSVAVAVIQFWCVVYLWSIRDPWMSILHVVSAVIMTALTLSRHYSVKAAKFCV